MARPLVSLIIAYVAGIILGRFFTPCIFILPTAFLIFWILWQVFKEKSGVRAFVPLLLLFLVAGGVRYHYALAGVKGNIRDFGGEKCTLVGMVEDEPLRREGDVVFLLCPEKILLEGNEYPANGKVRVTLRLDSRDSTVPGSTAKDKSFGNKAGDEGLHFLSYGQQVSLKGVLYEPQGQRNPGGFAYRDFLETQGMAATFYGAAKDAADLGPSAGLSYLCRTALQTKGKMSAILRAYLPSREGSLLVGMLFGERRGLDAATERYFSRCGVAHLLAVSGLHTGLVAAFILFVLNRLGFGRRKWFLFLLTAFFLFAYVFLTGVKPSALRAFIMILFGLLAYVLEREKDLPTALAAAAFLTLLYNPLLLFSAGFQFSYAATASIILLAAPWQEGLMLLLETPLFSFFTWRHQFASLAAVTLAAQLGVLPLSAFYFGEVSLVALLANVILLPLMSLVLGIGLFSALLGLFLPIAGSFSVLAALPLLAFMTWTTGFLGELVFAVLALYPPHSWEICAYYALLFSPAARGRNISAETPFRGLLASRILTILLILALLFAWWGGAFNFSGQLEVAFLDVGQGDAIFIQTPGGRYLLLDAGGRPPFSMSSYDPGDRVVVPFLQQKRVGKLDAVIISHPHEDHFGGMAAVLDRFPADLLLTSLAETDSVQYDELLALAQEKNIPQQTLQAGDRITLGPSLVLKILNPPEKLFSGGKSDLNDNSLVIQLCYKEVNFLFTGDMEGRAAKKLLESGVNLQSQIFKVPHHGSALEELPLLLQEVSPDLAIISVGKNSFGHPHPATLSELMEKDIEIYRTDLHGAITVRSNGYGWTVKTQLPTAALSFQHQIN
ncbi:MAG: DNA internalization-related competence protein ComEC/Rec2 [Dethiobacteria bacterium]